MQSRILTSFTTMTLLAVLALASLSASAQQVNKKRHYRFINLGTLGGTASGGNSLSNIGLVTGISNLKGDATSGAALWAYGLKRNLGTLGGPNSAVLFPVKNNFGEIVGVSETADTQPLGEEWSCAFFFATQPPDGHICLGFKWRFNKMVKLPTLGGDNGFAAGNNDFGQSVGWAENTTHDSTCTAPQVLQFEAVVWDKDNHPTQLSPLSPDADSAAVAINNRGQVVGISGDCDQAFGRFTARHAVLWEHGKATELKNLGGKAWNTPVAINRWGDVAGFADLPGDDNGKINSHAFFWTKKLGKMQDLGVLSGDAISLGLGMNDRGEIVGQSIGSASRAFLYADGKMIDLNSTLPKGSSLTLIFAGDINDQGEITGAMLDSRSPVKCAGGCAFLAIPVRDGESVEDASISEADGAEKNLPAPNDGKRSKRMLGRFGAAIR